MTGHGVFPFGRKVTILRQGEDPQGCLRPRCVRKRSPRSMGWTTATGKQKVAALAVASEPRIFWKGDGADEIISVFHRHSIYSWRATDARQRFNGPSGQSLDDCFLSPLGLTREDVGL